MDKSYDSGFDGFDVGLSYNPIQEDSTAQHQYSKGIGRARDESAEKRLMLAVLTDAVGSALQPKWSRASSEALEWIVEQDQEDVCSFVGVCEILGLEPAYVRKGILAEVASIHSFRIGFEARGPRRKVVPIRVAA